MCACVLSHISHVQPFATPWPVALQAPLSVGFSRQVYWSGLPRPPPEDLPDLGFESASLMFPARRLFTSSAMWEASSWVTQLIIAELVPNLRYFDLGAEADPTLHCSLPKDFDPRLGGLSSQNGG